MRKKKPTDAAVVQPVNTEEMGAEALIIDADAGGLLLVTDEQKIRAEADALAELYADFSIQSLRTEEDVATASADLRMLVRIRRKLDARRLASNRNTNQVAATIQSWLSPTEEKLALALDEYKRKESDRLRIEAEKRATEIRGRESELYNLGAAWGGSMFQLGMVMATRAEMEDDTRWPVLLAQFQAECERIAEKARTDAKAETDAAEERARVAAEMVKMQNEAAAKLAEAEKKAEAALAVLRRARASELAGFGAVREYRLPDGSVVDAGTDGAVLGMALGGLFATRIELEFEDDEWAEVLVDYAAEKLRMEDRVAMDERIEENQRVLLAARESAFGSLPNARPATPGVETAADAVAPDAVQGEEPAADAESPVVAPAPAVPAAVVQKFVPIHPGQDGFREQVPERIWLSGFHAALHAARDKSAAEFPAVFNTRRAELGL